MGVCLAVLSLGVLEEVCKVHITSLHGNSPPVVALGIQEALRRLLTWVLRIQGWKRQ